MVCYKFSGLIVIGMVDLQTGGAWRTSDTYVFKPTSATASNRATADGAADRDDLTIASSHRHARQNDAKRHKVPL